MFYSEFAVAIPSYQRPEKLLRCTLQFLESEKVPKSIITVFVANPEEETRYKSILPSDYKIVVGVKGISQQRLFIRNYFPEGQKVVCLDDDVKKLKYLRDDLSFLILVERMFQICLEENLTTFGLYPVNNLFFCKDRVIRGRFYVIGCCYGYINKHDLSTWLPEKGTKEDFWYSLKRIELDGAVLRYDGACPDTVYYAKGGLSEVRTLAVEEEEAKQVVSLFPTLASFIVKKNKHPDVKIKRLIENSFSLF